MLSVEVGIKKIKKKKQTKQTNKQLPVEVGTDSVQHLGTKLIFFPQLSVELKYSLIHQTFSILVIKNQKFNKLLIKNIGDYNRTEQKQIGMQNNGPRAVCCNITQLSFLFLRFKQLFTIQTKTNVFSVQQNFTAMNFENKPQPQVNQKHKFLVQTLIFLFSNYFNN